ncbi:MAG: right-handed parallel beta-helix repeat-containing protein [Candidatus Cloacimonadota bacterium]|nr:right-handed parallel beta-helix repeat-containing protein [Candidatus Cloacimonadota bacterium]
MKNLVLILVLSLSGSFLFSQTTIPAGNVSGTWSLSGSPYLIEGEIEIPDGETLIIDPGCLIEFQGHYALNVQGRLLAIGSEQDSIRFTIADTTGFYNNYHTGWRGIHFEDNISSNEFSEILYSTMEFGKGYLIISLNDSKLFINNSRISFNRSDARGTAISCVDSELNLNNSILSYNICDESYCGAIYCRDSNIEIINNTVYNNRSRNGWSNTEGAVYIRNCAGIFQNNEIYGNLFNYNSRGAGIYCIYSDIDIVDNTIDNNEGNGIIISCSEALIENNILTNSGYHGIILYEDKLSLVTRNEIYNNESCGIKLEYSSTRIEKNIIHLSYYGIQCLEDSSPIIRNNVIHNCSEYGIYIDESNPIILNCTIADNQERAIRAWHGSSVILINSILWGNSYNHISNYNSEFYISNCCIENGTSSMNFTPNFYENNITENPWFSVNGYYLCSNSPCIDAGAQWIGTDSDGSIIDIGCYTTSEFAGSGELPPNMVSGSIAGKISENVIFFGNVTVDIYDQLIIYPGVKINCFGGLNILGSILAIGNPSQYIEFTGVDQFPWNGVYIEDNSSFANEFEFCKFNNSTSSAIYSVDANLEILNCEFYDNSAIDGGAINIIINSDELIGIEINHTFFHDNYSNEDGGAINIYNQGDLTTTNISNNTFIDNEAGGRGGAINSSYSAIIKNNSIMNNEGSNGGGVYCLNSKIVENCIENNEANYGGGIKSYNSEIFNNFIKNNTAVEGGGIHLDRRSNINDSKIVGNLISCNNANRGGGIWGAGENQIVNCTIADNQSNTGAGYYCENSSNSIMNNCIIWGNSALEDNAQVYLNAYWLHYYEPGVGEIYVWMPANLNIYYSNIEGGFEEIFFNYEGSTPEYPITYDFEYENNYDFDPLFLSEEDFHFNVLSPCINAGTPDTIGLSLPEYDLDGNQRILGNSIDLGCFESQVAFIEHNEINFGDVQVMTISEAIEVIITNPLDQVIQIFSITASEDYFIKLLPEHEYSEQLLDILVPAVSQVSFLIACLPKEQGELIGEIDIISNNFSSENTIVTSVNGIYVFELYNNFPNPFNPETTIQFSIPQESKVELIVYNIKGQKVKTLVNNMCEEGFNTIIWNGMNDNGKQVSTGIYFYNLNVNNKSIKTKKMLLIK